MRCLSCQADVPEESHFCSVCGAPTQGAVAVADSTAHEAETLLAQANLCRMREQWEQAEARCIEVMRADPNNVHAHSLLGDIYRDQGKLDDAAQWYQMALDLNPDSVTDRAKLDLVDREQARKLGVVSITSARDGHNAVSGTQKIAGLPPVLWLRGLGVISALFVVAVVIIVLLINANKPAAQVASTGNIPGIGSPTPVPTPAGMENGVARASIPAPASITPQASLTSRPVSAPVPPAPAPAISSAETALQTALTRNSRLSPEVQIGEVIIDPRDALATVTLVEQPSGGMTPDVLHDAALRDALTAARTVFSADHNLQHVSVSVRVASPNGRAEPYFQGDIERNAAGVVAPDAPIAQIASLFGDIWWGPVPATAAGDEGGQ